MRRDLALALALVAALGTAYLFGRCARERGVSIEAWQDSTAAAHAGTERAVAAFTREQLATAAVSASLDSALRGWRAAAARSRVVGVSGPATVGEPALDPLYVPGVKLAKSCSAYQSACERAMAAADVAIDSLRHENDLLRRRPADPGEPRLQPFVAGGWDVGAKVPVAKLGAELRISDRLRLSVDASRRLTPGDTTRFSAWVTWRF